MDAGNSDTHELVGIRTPTNSSVAAIDQRIQTPTGLARSQQSDRGEFRHAQTRRSQQSTSAIRPRCLEAV